MTKRTASIFICLFYGFTTTYHRIHAVVRYVLEEMYFADHIFVHLDSTLRKGRGQHSTIREQDMHNLSGYGSHAYMGLVYESHFSISYIRCIPKRMNLGVFKKQKASPTKFCIFFQN